MPQIPLPQNHAAHTFPGSQRCVDGLFWQDDTIAYSLQTQSEKQNWKIA